MLVTWIVRFQGVNIMEYAGIWGISLTAQVDLSELDESDVVDHCQIMIFGGIRCALHPITCCIVIVRGLWSIGSVTVLRFDRKQLEHSLLGGLFQTHRPSAMD